MTAVVIGIDPHKRSNTALVLDSQENVLAKQRFPNDRNGYRQLKRFAQPWADRTWAVEGARGVGLGLGSGSPPTVSGCWTCPPGFQLACGPWAAAVAARPTTPTPTPWRSPGCATATCRSSSLTRSGPC